MCNLFQNSILSSTELQALQFSIIDTPVQNCRHTISELQTLQFRIIVTPVQNCRHTSSELQSLQFRIIGTPFQNHRHYSSELQTQQFRLEAFQCRIRAKPYLRYTVNIFSEVQILLFTTTDFQLRVQTLHIRNRQTPQISR